jgi:hypothetical protein
MEIAGADRAVELKVRRPDPYSDAAESGEDPLSQRERGVMAEQRARRITEIGPLVGGAAAKRAT